MTDRSTNPDDGPTEVTCEGVASSHNNEFSMSTSHPPPTMGEPGWQDHIASGASRIGVLTLEPQVSFMRNGGAEIVEDHGTPMYSPITLSEFGVNFMLTLTNDPAVAVTLAMTKLLSFAGARERTHGVRIVDWVKVVDERHVRDDITGARNHITNVPTRCVAPPDFTLDRLVDAMNPDWTMMEHIMQTGALNGWSDEAQCLFDTRRNRRPWTRDEAETGLAQVTRLGQVAVPVDDLPIMHPAYFAQMPAGMVSSVAQTMKRHQSAPSLVDDDGMIDGEKIATASQPGTTQGSKRRKARSMSKNQRLQHRIDAKDDENAALQKIVSALADTLERAGVAIPASVMTDETLRLAVETAQACDTSRKEVQR